MLAVTTQQYADTKGVQKPSEYENGLGEKRRTFSEYKLVAGGFFNRLACNSPIRRPTKNRSTSTGSCKRLSVRNLGKPHDTNVA